MLGMSERHPRPVSKDRGPAEGRRGPDTYLPGELRKLRGGVSLRDYAGCTAGVEGGSIGEGEESAEPLGVYDHRQVLVSATVVSLARQCHAPRVKSVADMDTVVTLAVWYLATLKNYLIEP